MDEDTLRALKWSIIKWIVICQRKAVDRGTENCALCQKFLRFEEEESDNDCKGCPVREKTGRQYCENSPYVDWLRAGGMDVNNSENYTDEHIKYAQIELAFLQSLLPEGITKKEPE